MNQEEISDRRAELRREFPNDPLPPLMTPKGRVSPMGARARFSAVGCPHAKPEVFRALVKSGVSVDLAFCMTILASHGAQGLIEPLERYAETVVDIAKREACKKHPHSKYAEERAAKIEARASRWGTNEFHRGSEEETRTPNYPYREAQS